MQKVTALAQKALSYLPKDAKTFISSIYKLRPVVSVLHIGGPISTRTTTRISQQLDQISQSARAIAVCVNSSAGSLAQAHIITQKILGKAKQLKVPVLTFGQDNCVGTGFLILTAGDKVYVDTTTVVGNTNVGVAKMDFTGLYKGMMEDVEAKAPGTHYLDSQLKTTIPLSNQKRQEILDLSSELGQEVESMVKARRNLKGDKEPAEVGKLRIGQEAVDAGFADATGTITDVLTKQYYGATIQHILKSSAKSKLKDLKNKF